MLKIGSHVSFKKDKQLVGSIMEALGYGANTFMYYTGAPQNTNRIDLDKSLILEAKELMASNGIDINDVIVHAPYIINLANNDESKYNFSINFLKQECKRCEEIGTLKLVLHPGSHVGLGISSAIKNIANALNEVLKDTSVTILLETMAGKGTEVGRSFSEIKEIFDLVVYKDKLGICLDTCHLSDSGYDVSDFDSILKELEDLDLLSKVKCIHINDSKNVPGSHKDRHENIGFGEIGFDNLMKIINNDKLKDVPKILETPYIEGNPPYKFEIDMIRSGEFDSSLKEKVACSE